MLEYATNCIFIGTAGNGDAYLASLDPGTDSTEILLWDHETNDIRSTIADLLSSLAYANRLLNMVKNSDDAVNLEEIAVEFTRIKDRVNLSWHYGSLEETAGVKGKFKAKNQVRFPFYRSLWINYLLRNDRVHELNAVANAFGIVDHGAMNIEAVLAGPNLAARPATLLLALAPVLLQQGRKARSGHRNSQGWGQSLCARPGASDRRVAKRPQGTG